MLVTHSAREVASIIAFQIESNIMFVKDPSLEPRREHARCGRWRDAGNDSNAREAEWSTVREKSWLPHLSCRSAGGAKHYDVHVARCINVEGRTSHFAFQRTATQVYRLRTYFRVSGSVPHPISCKSSVSATEVY